jgi:hypothetical protein
VRSLSLRTSIRGESEQRGESTYYILFVVFETVMYDISFFCVFSLIWSCCVALACIHT